MSYDKINIMLERYFNGESSLEDEKVIKEFLFNTDDLPEELQLLKNQFVVFEELSGEALDDSFDQKIMGAISEDNLGGPVLQQDEVGKVRKHRFSYIVTALAASVLILLAIWTSIDMFNGKKAVLSNQAKALAYQQATDALSVLAVNFDKGLSQTQKVSKPLNKSFKMLDKMEMVNRGIESLEPVNKVSNVEIIKYNK